MNLVRLLPSRLCHSPSIPVGTQGGDVQPFSSCRCAIPLHLPNLNQEEQGQDLAGQQQAARVHGAVGGVLCWGVLRALSVCTTRASVLLSCQWDVHTLWQGLGWRANGHLR